MSIKYPKKVKVEVKPSRKKSQNILLQYMLGVVERSLKQTYSGEKKHLADIELSGCNLANWPLQWPALWTDHDWALYSVWHDLMVRMIPRRCFFKDSQNTCMGILSPGMNLWPSKTPALKSDMSPLCMSGQNMYPLLCVWSALRSKAPHPILSARKRVFAYKPLLSSTSVAIYASKYA